DRARAVHLRGAAPGRLARERLPVRGVRGRARRRHAVPPAAARAAAGAAGRPTPQPPTEPARELGGLAPPGVDAPALAIPTPAEPIAQPGLGGLGEPPAGP